MIYNKLQPTRLMLQRIKEERDWLRKKEKMKTREEEEDKNDKTGQKKSSL